MKCHNFSCELHVAPEKKFTVENNCCDLNPNYPRDCETRKRHNRPDPLRHKMEVAVSLLSDQEKKAVLEIKTEIQNTPEISKDMRCAIAYFLVTEG